MVVVALPDVLKSTADFLKQITEVVALVNTAGGWQNGGSGPRVGMTIGANWKVGAPSVLLRRAGGRGALGAGMHETRIDVWSMAASERDAVAIWSVVHPALAPNTGDGIVGWKLSGCRVTDVEQDADPIFGDDLEVGYFVLVTPYLLRWREAPAP